MLEYNRLVLSWMVYVDTLFKNNPGRINIFLTGFMAALLLAAMFSAFYRFFALGKERARDVRYGIRAGTVAAVFCMVLGFCVFPLPFPGINGMAAGSVLQSAGLIGFEITLVFTALLSDYRRKFNRLLLGFLIAGGGAGMFLPLFFPLRSAVTLGCFSLIMTLLSVFFALRFRCRNCLIAGVEFFLLAASLFIPFPMPQILIWTLVMVFSLLSDPLTVPRRGEPGRDRSAGVPEILNPGPEQPEEELFRGKERERHDEPAERPAEEPEETMLPEKTDAVAHAINPFVPREFLNILNKDTVMDLQLGDHAKQEMTIFFSDIRQFTDLSENLTPEESFKFINSYLSRIVPEITENGGFVDKYIGDAILALYPQLSGADMAVHTAIAIQKKILEYNIHRASCGYRPLSMGIGLHTGTLMLGVVGVEGRMQNTVISDAVNLASRLESITKFFNISMAISEQTFKKLADPGAYMYRFIGKVRVKGKSEPVSVFEIFDGIKSDIMERKMKANMYFEQGMLSYYQKEFGEALINFRKVLDILPEDGASLFYMQNCLEKIKIAQL
jgi:two-component system sensor histidine kinase ChiS